MDYRLTLKRRGKGDLLYRLLSKMVAKDLFDGHIFEVEEISRDKDSVHVDMEIDIDRLVYQMLLRVLASKNLNLNTLGADINLGKKPKKRARVTKKAATKPAPKKSAPRTKRRPGPKKTPRNY